MALHINTLIIDSRDPRALARFWAEALGWQIVEEDDEEVLLVASLDRTPIPGRFPMLFGRNDDPKQVKNRLHLDLTPDDQEAEVLRLEGLGARRTDIGQGDVSWVVMADPEGNEFCVLRSLPSQGD